MSVCRNFTIEEIRYKGLKALADSLGPVGMVKFLQQFEHGEGDYTKDRRQVLENYTIEEIAAGIKTARKKEGQLPFNKKGGDSPSA